MVNTNGIAAVLKRATDTGDVAGVVATVGTRSGLIYEGAFGKRALGADGDMTADTVCWIASMTKAVTGAAAMQLVEQGKLSLDGPIAAVLPELKSPKVFEGFDGAGKARLRAAKTDITLRHLLTHTAGFTYDIWSADMARYQKDHAIPGIISCTNAALTTPLLFDPGTRWEYGINIDWAGKAVEAASGQKIGAYLKANIFDPLGMKDTGFKIGADQRKRLAAIHVRTPEGLAATTIELTQDPEFEMGGGGLYSTMADYMRFARMILTGGALDGVRVLRADTIATMSKNAMGPIRCGVMTTADPGSSNDVAFTNGMEWGLSFMINPAPMATGRSAGSLAWAGLANSYYWIDPVKGIAGAFATQILPFADVKALAAFQAFETEVYQAV
jgi:methyl acetate hydrolase